MLLSPSFRNRWRPPLSFVVAVVLGIMLLVPLGGIVFFRVYENQLIQTTEAELIAQSAAIAATTAQQLKEVVYESLPLGAKARSPKTQYSYLRKSLGEWSPQLPTLDLNKTPILPRRPAAIPSDKPVHDALKSVGQKIDPILQETQKLTLAGFRILDANGVVIAGRDEIGHSLAHVSEVGKALSGQYASALRERIVDNPQPIYSISRGTSVRVFTALPIVVDGRVAGVVYASRTPSNILKEMFLKRETVFWVLAFVLGATFVVGVIFVRAISGPIRALTARSLKIGSGDRDALKPLATHGNREIYALSSSMLEMSRKLFERNDYINTFANHVTHEMKTPLTSIQGAAELLLDGGEGLSEAERSRFLQNILSDTARASRLLNRLRELARADSIDIGGSCRLVEVLGEIGATRKQLNIEWDRDCVLPLSKENARIVFENLIENSQKHGASTVTVSVTESDDGLTLHIADNGDGISPGNAEQIFDLFFTTRREEGGTGMGLGIVQAVLQAHGAVIRLKPDWDAGTCFEISFER
ncbi:MAG: HAMP domain-containing protein [Roseibium sp.]|uniref:HAMP domain-containing sensor histidine kinase n=1 Tax=Roseibium sp. TaxID=1936156 RepID=UPI002605590E|nr:ATP-binding protein [Roseibium sp.]MCV0424087.1 HAMP domain-containing protein [Roseibium sp.]